MDVGRRRKVVETVYDKPLPLKGKPEVRKGKGDRKGTLLWLCCSIQPFAMARSYFAMGSALSHGYIIGPRCCR